MSELEKLLARLTETAVRQSQDIVGIAELGVLTSTTMRELADAVRRLAARVEELERREAARATFAPSLN